VPLWLLLLEALEFLLTMRYFVGFSEVKRLLLFLLLACERETGGYLHLWKNTKNRPSSICPK